MTNSEKLLLIAENQPKVYQAGYNAGVASGGTVIPQDKILSTTITGNIVYANNISEIPHQCTITSDKDTEVTICGKNIFDISTAKVYHNNASQPSVDMYVTETGMRLESIKDFANSSSVWGFYLGTSQELAGKTITVSGDVISTITESRLSIVSIYAIDVEPTTVREKPRYSDGGYVGSSNHKIRLAEGTNPSGRAAATYTVTGEEEKPYIAILFYFTLGGSGGVEDWTEWSDIQVEIGSSVSSYEQYKGITKTIESGQEILVESICPSMSILPNNDAIVTFTYQKSWGMDQAWHAFWDAFQLGGGRMVYSGAFNTGWTPDLFRPKYDIVAQSAYSMFNNFLYNQDPVSLKQLLVEAGVTLTFPSCSNFSNLFNSARITEIGELDFHSATVKTCSSVFAGCKYLKTIDKIILPNGQTSFSNWFQSCQVLENITFEGEIGVAISFVNSPLLTNTSVQSIIDHLKDLTGATAQTLTLHATVGAALTEEQKTMITAKNWTLVY